MRALVVLQDVYDEKGTYDIVLVGGINILRNDAQSPIQ